MPLVRPDLEYRRSDREKRDRAVARSECGVQRQRSIKKINRKYSAKTMADDQISPTSRSAAETISAANLFSLCSRIELTFRTYREKKSVVERYIQMQPAPRANQKRCEQQDACEDADKN